MIRSDQQTSLRDVRLEMMIRPRQSELTDVLRRRAWEDANWRREREARINMYQQRAEMQQSIFS